MLRMVMTSSFSFSQVDIIGIWQEATHEGFKTVIARRLLIGLHCLSNQTKGSLSTRRALTLASLVWA